MSEFHFGVGAGRVPEHRARKINSIARKHGAQFFAVKLPEGHRYWFSAPNKGAPWDARTRNAVINALEAADLWPVEVAA